MQDNKFSITRRKMIMGALAAGAIGLFAPGVFAQHLDDTPPVEEGPFYPYHEICCARCGQRSDHRRQLQPTPAVGQITHLGGRILDGDGNPIKNALVEIWQCDSNGLYIVAEDKSHEDKNFQGYGRFTTASDGGYRFRTIKPVPLQRPPRSRTIHFKIKQGGQELLTTQLFIRGYPANTQDGVYMTMRDPVDRELASADFKPIKDSKIGELSAKYDIVIGRTPADPEPDHHG